MYKTNTKNVNNKLNKFKADILLRKTFKLYFRSKQLSFNDSKNCWNNDIVCNVSIPKTVIFAPEILENSRRLNLTELETNSIQTAMNYN